VIELVPHFTGADREPEEVRLEPGRSCSTRATGVISSTSSKKVRSRYTGSAMMAARNLSPSAGKGNYFGELGPMLNLPRSASAGLARPVA